MVGLNAYYFYYPPASYCYSAIVYTERYSNIKSGVSNLNSCLIIILTIRYKLEYPPSSPLTYVSDKNCRCWGSQEVQVARATDVIAQATYLCS